MKKTTARKLTLNRETLVSAAGAACHRTTGRCHDYGCMSNTVCSLNGDTVCGDCSGWCTVYQFTCQPTQCVEC